MHLRMNFTWFVVTQGYYFEGLIQSDPQVSLWIITFVSVHTFHQNSLFVQNMEEQRYVRFFQ